MLIGLTGHAGAGKDSVAMVLLAAGWHSVAYADALRVEVAEAWRLVDHRLLTERRTKELPTVQLAAGHVTYGAWRQWCREQGHDITQPRSPRWALQQWGSFRRSIDHLHWVRPVTRWVQYQRAHGHHDLVVTDVRHDNEADSIVAHRGFVVRVHRPDLTPLAPDTARHESELHELILAQAEVHNSGPLADLGAEVWRVVQLLGKPTHRTTGAN